MASRGFSALDARAVVPPIPTQRKIPCILNRSWKFSSNPRQVLIVEVGVCERNSTNVLSLESQVIGFFFPFFLAVGHSEQQTHLKREIGKVQYLFQND